MSQATHPLLVVKYLRIMGYGLTGTLRDNPFEPDEMICDLEHYLRLRDFMKMGKRCAQAANELRVSTASGSGRGFRRGLIDGASLATARGTDPEAEVELFLLRSGYVFEAP